ncbi:MAG: hypothetical protein IPP40_17875 [bacterium]|nr:hypothetical protein [bacterium]
MKTDIASILLLSLFMFSCAENPDSLVGSKKHELDGTRWWPVELHGEIVINRVYEKFPICASTKTVLKLQWCVRGGETSAGRGIMIQEI